MVQFVDFSPDGLFMICLLVAIIGLLIGWMSTSGTKSQSIRLADVFLFGPFLIFAAFVHNFWISLLLIIIGTATMAYNFKNYLYEGK
jgi:predicted membrane protein